MDAKQDGTKAMRELRITDIDGKDAQIPPDEQLTPAQIKTFCDAHDVDFHALGTPPGVDDPHGTGWRDTSRMRVGTREGMMGGSSRGITVPFAHVRTWLAETTELPKADAGRLESILDDLRSIGGHRADLETAYLEQLLRTVHASLSAWGREELLRRDAASHAIEALGERFAIGTRFENVVTGARCQEHDYARAMSLSALLRDAILLLPANARKAFFQSEQIKRIEDLSVDLKARTDMAPR